MIKPALVDHELLKPKVIPKPKPIIRPKTPYELKQDTRMYINIFFILVIFIFFIILYIRKQEKEEKVKQTNQYIIDMHNYVSKYS